MFFCRKDADIRKIKEVLVLKGIFSETTCVFVLMYLCTYVYFCTNFQDSSIILTSFRRGNFIPTLPLIAKQNPKKFTQITVKVNSKYCRTYISRKYQRLMLVKVTLGNI